MSALVLSNSYRSTAGRKPSRPAFGFYFHNDDAGGMTVTDRFANAASLTVQGTEGTIWTASRGFIRPNGTDNQIITGSTNEYAAQTVMANALLTPGQALIVAARFGWAGTKNTSAESFLCLGRGHSSSASVQFGLSAGALLQASTRGTGASTLETYTAGSAGDYSSTAEISALWHCTAVAGGVEIVTWLNGVAAGQLRSHTWAANAGATPSLSAFAMPDGITLGAQRAGSSAGSPTWAQRVGASNSGGTRLAFVTAVNLAAADVATAQDLALELHNYPRAVGEILAGL